MLVPSRSVQCLVFALKRLFSYACVGTRLAPPVQIGTADLVRHRRGKSLSKMTYRATVWIAGSALLLAGSLSAGQAQEASPSSSDDSARPGESSRAPSQTKAGSETPAKAHSDAVKAPEGYKIGVDDSLFISVWKEPDLSSQVTVRPDGVITMPLINEVQVVGLTPKELQVVLTEKLKPFVNEPQVTVIVRDIRSRKVFLVGQAGKPGSVPLSGNMTMMELLASAGGLGPFAKSESIYILRNQGGHQSRIPFHYKKVLRGKEADIVLEPGDMIVVP